MSGYGQELEHKLKLDYTANLLMTYLASVISKIGKYSLSTDEPKNFKTNIHSNIVDDTTFSIRENVIKDVLPFPVGANLKITKLQRNKL